MARRHWLWLPIVLLSGACTLERSGVSTPDSGPRDMPPGVDAGASDGGARDAAVDGGASDAGAPSDAGREDAGAEPACDASDPGLRVCLRFEDDTTDDSTYGNDAVGISVAFDTGTVGRGARLSAASGLTVDPAPSLEFTEASLEAWVRIDDVPSGSDRVGVLDLDGQFSLFVYSDGDVRCASGGTEVWDRRGVREGEWTHLACVFAPDRHRLYRDGTQRAEEPSTGLGTSNDGIWIGENGTSGNDQLRGMLDEVRVWGVARTSAQIRAEHERGAP